MSVTMPAAGPSIGATPRAAGHISATDYRAGQN